MNQILQSLYNILNKEVKFGIKSVDDEEISEVNSKHSEFLTCRDFEDLRFLTSKTYTEQHIKRKSSVPFQMRYSAYGEASNMMCAHAYAWHDANRIPFQGSPNAASFGIEFENSPVAMASLVFDSSDSGLSAEKFFPEEIDKLRFKHGHNLCEITSFAISKARKSRKTLAALLHLMFLYARQAKQMEGLIAQTRAHHVSVYSELLGFRKIAEKDGVVLVFIPLDLMRLKIRKFGGQNLLEKDEAGLYKFFFASKDEPGLLFRLLEHLAASGTRNG